MARSARAWSSAGAASAPVGFCRSLTIISLVRRRDHPLDGRDVDFVIGFSFAVGIGEGFAAVEFDLRFVDGVSRIGIKHLVAGIHQGQDEFADGGFPAGLDDDVVEGCIGSRGSG